MIRRPRMRFGRDVYVVAFSRLISELGDEMSFIALLFRVKDRGSGAVAGLFACGALARIALAPLAGSIVDRFPTRSLIRWVSVGQASLCIALTQVDGLAIYPLVLVLALGGSIVNPAWQAFIPTAVSTDDYPRVLAVLQSYRSLAMVGGASIGGLVVDALGVDAALLIDGATFLAVMLLTFALVHNRVVEGARIERRTAMRGFRVLFENRLLRALLVMLSVFNLCIGVIEVVGVFLVTDILGGSATTYGAVNLCFGASMFLSGHVLSRWKPRMDKTRIVVASAVVAASGVVMYGFAPVVWVCGFAMVVNGIGMSGLNVYMMPIMVDNTLDAERGRVLAASGSITQFGFLVSLSLAGVAGKIWSPRVLIVIGGIACLLSIVVNGRTALRAQRAVRPMLLDAP